VTPESKLKRDCKKIAKEHGCFLYPVAFKGRKGFPDQALLCPAQAWVLVEYKAPGGRLSQHQISTIIDLRMAGQETWVIYSVLQFKDQLGRVLSERPVRFS
jgi:VRR-NUC domain